MENTGNFTATCPWSFFPNLTVLVSHLSPLIAITERRYLEEYSVSQTGFLRTPSKFLKAVMRPRFPHLSYMPRSHPKIGNPKSLSCSVQESYMGLCFYAFLFPLSAVQIYAFTIS